jgi:amino acid transporter
MASVRGVFAMSFDRQMPIGLCKVSKSGVPTTAAHFVGVFALIGCFFGYWQDFPGQAGAAAIVAILDYTGMFFIWCVGLAGLFLPFTRPDLFDKTTFQYKWGGVPVISILGVICVLCGYYMIMVLGLEFINDYAQWGMAAIVALGFAIVAFMYHRNRKEGIDPNLIYSQIPPA